MSKVENDPSNQRVPAPRKLVGARRLLIATIGAATVNYAGCGDDTMTLVANLMAAPFMPPPDAGPHVAPNPSGLAGSQATPATPIDPDAQDGGTGESDLGARP
jgi:hypothetical protein